MPAAAGASASSDDGDAELQVSDTGPGLSPGEAAHVFDRFWRGSAGRSTAGSGIGLAVAAALAAAHHGTLTADDAAPGARFTLRLPLAHRPTGAAPAAPPAAPTT